LDGDIAYQIKTVLRLRPGDEVIVLDNSGLEWRVVLTEVNKNNVWGQIISQQPCQGEPKLDLTLYQATLKGQKFEWVLQKGTELGISGFVPTICQRSIIRNPAALAKKQARWRQIIREAAEQSGRGKLPWLGQPRPFEQAMAQVQARELVIIPWEEATGLKLEQVLAEAQIHTIALFIGPEGGFASEEIELARQSGARLVTLGPRILRAETAAIAVCAAIMYEMNEWR
jgi:16S rRNA (uracil1498-N3)-methyltransferase